MAPERDLSSDRALRACMQALVLLNLVFVHLTGAAGPHWLAPLFVVALAAPWLERFRERLLYRFAWNVVVVGFFALLGLHVTQGQLGSVLEDGLVLAVLCQVHLLNNLRSSQPPDLLFFNAFLIATISGYISEGVGFSIAFFAFVPSFVIGLQLLSATRGGRRLDPGAAARFVADGARRSGWLLAFSALVFLFWPRDFHRKPFLEGRFDFASRAPEELEVGFSEALSLDRSQRVTASDEEVLRVTLLEGARADVPALWRGATLAATTGGAWSVASTHPWGSALPDDPWQDVEGRLVRASASEVAGARVEVLRHAQDTERLFVPLGAVALQLAGGDDRRLRARGDGTVDIGGTEDARYVIRLGSVARRALGGAVRAELPVELRPFVDLPITDRIDRAAALAARLVAEQRAAPAPESRAPEGLAPERAAPAPAQAPAQKDLVARISDHLSDTYTYLAPGTPGAATTLDMFLQGKRGGHCEFFASALATMLRSVNVPARVVTGYRSSNWSSDGRVLVFGARDAHAWVEVHDPEGGWYAVDPSPRNSGVVSAPSLWARARAQVQALWATVTSFDAERRAAAFDWLRTRPAALAALLRRAPFGSALVGALVALLLHAVIRRRRARTPAVVRAYHAALRRARLRALPGETPRELLARAQASALTAAHLDALAQATRAHEADRYAA